MGVLVSFSTKEGTTKKSVIRPKVTNIYHYLHQLTPPTPGPLPTRPRIVFICNLSQEIIIHKPLNIYINYNTSEKREEKKCFYVRRQNSFGTLTSSSQFKATDLKLEPFWLTVSLLLPFQPNQAWTV